MSAVPQEADAQDDKAGERVEDSALDEHGKEVSTALGEQLRGHGATALDPGDA